jgi:hypothetical protein
MPGSLACVRVLGVAAFYWWQVTHNDGEVETMLADRLTLIAPNGDTQVLELHHDTPSEALAAANGGGAAWLVFERYVSGSGYVTWRKIKGQHVQEVQAVMTTPPEAADATH